jgi:hypothetical protein
VTIAQDTDDILGVWGETVVVVRNSITYGNDGAASSESWGQVVSCLADIQPNDGSLKVGPVGEQRMSTHRIFFPNGTAVIPGDRVRAAGWATGDDEYQVDFILNEEGHVEVAASIVRGQA